MTNLYTRDCWDWFCHIPKKLSVTLHYLKLSVHCSATWSIPFYIISTPSLNRSNWTICCAPSTPWIFFRTFAHQPEIVPQFSSPPLKILISSGSYPQSHRFHKTLFESLNQIFPSLSKPHCALRSCLLPTSSRLSLFAPAGRVLVRVVVPHFDSGANPDELKSSVRVPIPVTVSGAGGGLWRSLMQWLISKCLHSGKGFFLLKRYFGRDSSAEHYLHGYNF